MSFCPFMSERSKLENGLSNLYPCVKTCELYTSKGCALKVLAIAQHNLSQNSTNNPNDKS